MNFGKEHVGLNARNMSEVSARNMGEEGFYLRVVAARSLVDLL